MISKHQIATGLLALAIVIGIKYTVDPQMPKGISQETETQAQTSARKQPLQLESSLMDPFGGDLYGFELEVPDLGLTLGPPEVACVDTHLVTDISCADKAAVISFRKAQIDLLKKQIEDKIKELEMQQLHKDFGMREA